MPHTSFPESANKAITCVCFCLFNWRNSYMKETQCGQWTVVPCWACLHITSLYSAKPLLIGLNAVAFKPHLHFSCFTSFAYAGWEYGVQQDIILFCAFPKSYFINWYRICILTFLESGLYFYVYRWCSAFRQAEQVYGS